MDSMSTNSMLLDSTRPVTNGRGGSVCTDTDLGSDMTSDITSGSVFSHGSLADYQLDRLLGRGKYSQVYLAKDLRTGELVAIKRVEIFDMMDQASRQACVKEVKILQNVEHPNIVKCFRSFLSNEANELVIVLEWAEGGDLGHVIKQRLDAGQAFTPEQVWVQFQQVCSALKHMHDRRMMHRDLKPTNIFVTASGDLKLGDLGLSRYFSSRTLQAQTTVGTPYYMSPEVVRGQPYDFSSDIWSLGCLLYELIALRNPFYKESQSLYVLGKLIQNCQYEPLPASVPDELRQLVSSMLQPQPQSRPTISQLFSYVNAYLAQHLPHTQQRLQQEQQQYMHPHGHHHHGNHLFMEPQWQPAGAAAGAAGGGAMGVVGGAGDVAFGAAATVVGSGGSSSTGGAVRHMSASGSGHSGVSAGGGGGGGGGGLDLGITGHSICLTGRGLNSTLPR